MKYTWQSYNFDNVERIHTTILEAEDSSKKYIFIDRGMIFVADFDLEELTRRIEAEDIFSYEAYDTTDGTAYFLDSDVSTEICEALINLANTLL